MKKFLFLLTLIPLLLACGKGPVTPGLDIDKPGTEPETAVEPWGEAGAGASPCSYFSPIRTLAITPNLTLRYEIWITAGSTATIRQTFQDVRAGKYGNN